MADIAEAAIAPLEQMQRRIIARLAMRHADGDIERHRVDIHQFGNAHARALQHRHRVVRMVQAGDDHGRRLPGEQRGDQRLFRVHVVVGDSDHRLVARRGERGMNAAQHIREHDVGQRREHHPDQVGAGRSQCSSDPIRHIAHLTDDREHTLARLLGDRRLVAQHARDGDLAYFRALRHIGQGIGVLHVHRDDAIRVRDARPCRTRLLITDRRA